MCNEMHRDTADVRSDFQRPLCYSNCIRRVLCRLGMPHLRFGGSYPCMVLRGRVMPKPSWLEQMIYLLLLLEQARVR